MTTDANADTKAKLAELIHKTRLTWIGGADEEWDDHLAQGIIDAGWSEGLVEDNSETWPLVTRVEIIDADGRDVVRYYEDAGATLAVQNNGRTIKIFVGRKRGRLTYPTLP